MSKQDTIISLLKEINESVDDLDTTFVTTDLAITENGQYKPIDYNVEGFNIVDVNVSPTLEEITITENGEYIPSEGVDGFSKVVVEAGSSNKVVLGSVRVNNTDLIDGYWAAELVDTSRATSISCYYCTDLTHIDVSSWDTSNVTDFSNVFFWCKSLQSIDISNWDVSKAKYMQQMFYRCESLQQLDLSSWNVSNVTSVREMFHYCTNLQQLNLSNWNLSNVTDLYAMFASCSSLQTLNVYGWNTSNVTKIDNMFDSCYKLQQLDLRTFDANNVTSAYEPFRLCKVLESLVGGKTIDEVISNNITILNGFKITAISLFSQFDTIDRASLRALINGLADITGQTTQTLSIGTTLIAKLTEEDIAIATAKNWTIA